MLRRWQAPEETPRWPDACMRAPVRAVHNAGQRRLEQEAPVKVGNQLRNQRWEKFYLSGPTCNLNILTLFLIAIQVTINLGS